MSRELWENLQLPGMSMRYILPGSCKGVPWYYQLIHYIRNLVTYLPKLVVWKDTGPSQIPCVCTPCARSRQKFGFWRDDSGSWAIHHLFHPKSAICGWGFLLIYSLGLGGGLCVPIILLPYSLFQITFIVKLSLASLNFSQPRTCISQSN